MEQIQPGVFRKSGELYTRAAAEQEVYGEKFIEIDGEKYRKWNPNRSKAAAGIMNGIDLDIQQDDSVLYLGAASGTTVSHFSDILTEGFIVAVEYSDTVIRDLVKLAEQRENIAPLLEDARKPQDYEDMVPESDIVFQDISQPDQAEIFIRNCKKFLKQDGTGLLAVKARSISTSESLEEIFEDVRQKIEEEFEIVEETELEPYEKEHLFLKLKKK